MRVLFLSYTTLQVAVNVTKKRLSEGLWVSVTHLSDTISTELPTDWRRPTLIHRLDSLASGLLCSRDIIVNTVIISSPLWSHDIGYICSLERKKCISERLLAFWNKIQKNLLLCDMRIFVVRPFETVKNEILHTYLLLVELFWCPVFGRMLAW